MNPSSFLCCGETISGVLGPVLSSPVEERHGYNVVSAVRGHGGDKGIGTSVMQGDAEGARAVQLR